MTIRSVSVLLVGAMLAASAPVHAQGKGHGGGAGKGKSSEHAQGGEQKAARSRGRANVGQARSRAQEHSREQEAVVRAPAAQSRARVKQGRSDVAQERGRGKSSDKGDKLTGRANAAAKRIENVSGGEVKKSFGLSNAARGRFARELEFEDVAPPARMFVSSPRPGDRLVGKAVALAFARGVPDNALVIVPAGPRYVVRNLTGDVILDLDERRAINPGYWKVVTLDDRVKDGAPAFCRSGAGHPVWGRQWCLDKGFGLGTDQNFRWARTVDPRDVVFRSIGTGSVTRDALLGVLGSAVVDRLGLHALTLGYTDPITGRWLGDGTGPRVLLLTSGSYPVAEIVDANGDNRADNLLVALRPW